MADHISSGEDSAARGPGDSRARVQARAAEAARRKSPLNIVFMGTPDFAARILDRLLSFEGARILAAYTQPDRPAGRGKALRAPAVKLLAEKRGIPVRQPLNFKADERGDEAFADLAALKPDVLVVAAYGLILPQRVLDIPKLMPINVHASLLPKYRGAAPIQRAIMNGDAVTGVTIMKMEAGLDTGPILMQRAVGIGINDSSADLHDELAVEGAELLVAALERLSAGVLAAIAQDDAKATYANKLGKEESLLDLSLPAAELHARIRALTPWPGACLRLERKGQEDLVVQAGPGVFPPPSSARVKEPSSGACDPPVPGSILGLADDALLVACGDGSYAFNSLRPAGRKSMDGKAFFNGYLAGAQACFSRSRDTAHPARQSN